MPDESRLEQLRLKISAQMQALQKLRPSPLKSQDLYKRRKPLYSDSTSAPDAARVFAEMLTLQDEAGASKLLTEDQEGDRTFSLMAISALGNLDTKLPKVADAIGDGGQMPFYYLAVYVLECMRLDEIPPPPPNPPAWLKKTT